MRMENGKRPSSFAIRGGMLRTQEEEKKESKEEKAWDLSGMALTSLPSPTFNPALLTKLDLSNNNLESLPESTVARLLNVVVLDLHSNQLKALPNSMGCLSKLKILNVSGNMLESLPKTIEDCRALEEIIANFNKLTALPDTMGFELTNLRQLRVNSNKLATLPFSTSHMTSLRLLDVHLNCLRSLPDDLENLSRLEILNVSQNFQYLTSLPPSVGLLSSLLELDISYNSIAVLPDSLSCLGKLEKLKAEGNPLISPPMDVVDQSVDAVRQYLAEKMNKRFFSEGEEVMAGETGQVRDFPSKYDRCRCGPPRGGWALHARLSLNRWVGIAEVPGSPLPTSSLLPEELSSPLPAEVVCLKEFSFSHG